MMSPASVLRDGVVWYSGTSSRRFFGLGLPDFDALLFMTMAYVVALPPATRTVRWDNGARLEKRMAIARKGWCARQRYTDMRPLGFPEALNANN